MLKRNMRKHFLQSEKPTSDNVLLTYSFADVTTHIRKRRLLYFRRLIATGPLALRAIIASNSTAEGSWASMIKEDLQFMFESIGHGASMPNPSVDLPGLCRFALNPNRWKRCVRSFVEQMEQGLILTWMELKEAP